MRLLVRQWLLGRHDRSQPVWRTEKTRQDTDGGRVMRTFKALSALLSYPDEELQNAAAELRNVVDEESLLPADDRRLLDPLIDEIATGDLYVLQERYVELFDRTRSLSLHLFEHVHGE